MHAKSTRNVICYSATNDQTKIFHSCVTHTKSNRYVSQWLATVFRFHDSCVNAM